MELLKLLSTNELVAQTISFLILLFILRKMVWKTFLKVLDDRKDRIAKELKTIEDSKKDIEALRAECEKNIKFADQMYKARIQEGVLEAQRIADEIKKKAHQEAQEILQKERANIRYEISQAKEELKEKVIDLVLAATQHVIEEKLTPEEDKKIVETFLSKVDKI